MFRKNGKPTSCEPCRISKIRCDHTTPTCKRCETRGLTSKCYYHPAPLTRSSSKRRNKTAKARIAFSRPGIENGRHYTDDRLFPFHVRRQGGEPFIQNTHLGSAGFLPVFRGNSSGLAECPSLPPSVDLERWRGDRVYIASQLIRLLCSLDLYIELITGYYAFEVFTIVPARLILDALQYTKIYLESNGWLEKSRQEDLYAKITENTASPLPTTATTPEEFYSSYAGENLRWEFVGIVFSLAGVGVVCFPAPRDSVLCLDSGEQLNTEEFTAEMATAGNACVQLSKRYDNINDLMVWLQCSNTGLSADVFGETSHHVYGLFGDLVSDIYGMELHRYKPPESDVPFFLSEIRKKIFASLYRTDKNLATFVGRPPRLPYQYCDAALPLEIDNDAPFLDGAALETVLKNVNPDGWNVTGTSGGKIRSSAVIRLRYTTSRLREKVLELSLGRKTENFSRELMETHRDIKQLWANIPVHFHYNPECWESRDPITALFTLVIHLEYLYTVFQIDRIRCRENQGEMKDLIDTSMQVLSAVKDFARHKQDHKHLDQFSWLFVLYATPCAGVVATELHRCTISDIPLPSSSTRSTIIRNLSVMVSWLETENHPCNPTHKANVEVNKAITKLLDDTLNYQPMPAEPLGVVDPNATHGVQRHGEDNAGGISQQPIGYLQPETAGNDPVNDIVFDSSENFLKWLDELGVDATVPELPL